MDTPVLLITFNRPTHTSKVLSAIRRIKPKILFVFQDGVRDDHSDDIKRSKLVREIISQGVDWSCDLHTLYSEKNLGCGPGPATAISWFFKHVDQGIILEDDAVPNSDFFSYAEELLKLYKDDNSVRAIGSMNVDTHPWGDGSYYFSMMNRNLCAWATWERAWCDFDLNLSRVSRKQLNRALKHYGCTALERAYWCDRLDEIHKNVCDGKSWDMQFFMSIWLNRGKGIIPNVNLSSNIGTVGEATHALSANNIIDSIPTRSIMPLRHPSTTSIQIGADREFHSRYFEPEKQNWSRFKILYNLANRRLKKLVGHEGPWIKRKRIWGLNT